MALAFKLQTIIPAFRKRLPDGRHQIIIGGGATHGDIAEAAEAAGYRFYGSDERLLPELEGGDGFYDLRNKEFLSRADVHARRAELAARDELAIDAEEAMEWRLDRFGQAEADSTDLDQGQFVSHIMPHTVFDEGSLPKIDLEPILRDRGLTLTKDGRIAELRKINVDQNMVRMTELIEEGQGVGKHDPTRVIDEIEHTNYDNLLNRLAASRGSGPVSSLVQRAGQRAADHPFIAGLRQVRQGGLLAPGEQPMTAGEAARESLREGERFVRTAPEALGKGAAGEVLTGFGAPDILGALGGAATALTNMAFPETGPRAGFGEGFDRTKGAVLEAFPPAQTGERLFGEAFELNPIAALAGAGLVPGGGELVRGGQRGLGIIGDVTKAKKTGHYDELSSGPARDVFDPRDMETVLGRSGSETPHTELSRHLWPADINVERAGVTSVSKVRGEAIEGLQQTSVAFNGSVPIGDGDYPGLLRSIGIDPTRSPVVDGQPSITYLGTATLTPLKRDSKQAVLNFEVEPVDPVTREVNSKLSDEMFLYLGRPDADEGPLSRNVNRMLGPDFFSGKTYGGNLIHNDADLRRIVTPLLEANPQIERVEFRLNQLTSSDAAIAPRTGVPDPLEGSMGRTYIIRRDDYLSGKQNFDDDMQGLDRFMAAERRGGNVDPYDAEKKLVYEPDAFGRAGTPDADKIPESILEQGIIQLDPAQLRSKTNLGTDVQEDVAKARKAGVQPSHPAVKIQEAFIEKLRKAGELEKSKVVPSAFPDALINPKTGELGGPTRSQFERQRAAENLKFFKPNPKKKPQ